MSALAKTPKFISPLDEALQVVTPGNVARNITAEFETLSASLLETLAVMCAHADRGEWEACAELEPRCAQTLHAVAAVAATAPSLRYPYGELLKLAAATNEALLMQCRDARNQLGKDGRELAQRKRAGIAYANSTGPAS